MTQNPRILGAIFFVFRVALIGAFAEYLLPHTNLEQNVKTDIKMQVKQTIIHYMNYYVFLIQTEDGGIRPRCPVDSSFS